MLNCFKVPYADFRLSSFISDSGSISFPTRRPSYREIDKEKKDKKKKNSINVPTSWCQYPVPLASLCDVTKGCHDGIEKTEIAEVNDTDRMKTPAK